MKTNRTSVFGMSLFCALVTWASSPAPHITYNFEPTPTGVVATVEFNTETDQLYSILRNPNLLSNGWSAVETDFPGTGTNEVFTDFTPLTSPVWFYKVTAKTAAPANILVNGDFETGTEETQATRSNPFDVPPWQRTFDNAWLNTSPTDAGEKSIRMRWAGTSVYQDFSVIPDRVYLFSIDALNPTDANNRWTPQLQIEWYDSGSSPIGSTIILDQGNNATDPYNTWYTLSGNAVAPAGASTCRMLFTLINTGGDADPYYFDNAYAALQPLGVSVGSESWTTFGNASLVAAAQYAGHYAVADNDIEINRIDESVVDTVDASEIEALLTGAGINAMAFTPSGRQLFVSVNGTSSDSVLAYNAGTGVLRNFATGLNLASSNEKLGLAHFKGELFVGTSAGEIRRYAADLNDATGSYNGSISFSGGDAGRPVRSIAVDIQDQMLYVASPDNLYRLNPTNSVMTQIATVSNIVDITVGRTYGTTGQGGLTILQNSGSQRVLHLVSNTELQSGGSVTPSAYYETGNAVPAIAATACGRLLVAGTSPSMLSDTNDTRMSFMEWVADEFDQNVLMAKSLCWQDGGLTGMVQNSATRTGKNRGSVSSPDSAFWVVNQLIMSDEVNGDPEAQAMVREIVKRHATLEVNTDGQWYHWYDANDGLLSWGGPDYETSCYSTMKGVHMAIRAKAYYPNDSEIVDAANTIIGKLRNQRDYVRDFGKFASPADDLGPVIDGHRPAPYQEIHLFGELMAAGEPMCENGYLDYWRYRDNHTYDYELPDEPIVRKNAAGFWRMYDQATISSCRDDAEWQQEFKNFYALFAGWTDDNTPEHLTAFSAGSTPSGYSADKYTSHPGTVNSFGTVIGFGLHGGSRGRCLLCLPGWSSATHAGIGQLCRSPAADPYFL
jgi:hypothetical protein